MRVREMQIHAKENKDCAGGFIASGLLQEVELGEDKLVSPPWWGKSLLKGRCENAHCSSRE